MGCGLTNPCRSALGFVSMLDLLVRDSPRIALIVKASPASEHSLQIVGVGAKAGSQIDPRVDAK